jgi:hypothetical protein
MMDSTKKRTLDAFFKPPPKKIRVLEEGQEGDTESKAQPRSIADELDEVSFEV